MSTNLNCLRVSEVPFERGTMILSLGLRTHGEHKQTMCHYCTSDSAPEKIKGWCVMSGCIQCCREASLFAEPNGI